MATSTSQSSPAPIRRRHGPAFWLRACAFLRLPGTEKLLRNPVVLHITGRRRGFLAEDVVALTPWVLLSIVEVVYILANWGFQSPMALLPLALAEGFLAPPLAGFAAGFAQVFHARNVRGIVPLEQLAVTKIRGEELTDGLAARPVQLQTLALLANTQIILLLFLVNVLSGGGFWVMWPTLLWVVGFLVLRWLFAQGSLHVGSALALRVCLLEGEEAVWMAQAVKVLLRHYAMYLTFVAGAGLSLLFAGRFGLPPVLVVMFWVLALFRLIAESADEAGRIRRGIAADRDYWWLARGADRTDWDFRPSLYRHQKRARIVVRDR
ncbi:MAG: hypothetical protein RLY93_13030 [Sumerlaeia bacterium]